MSQRRSFQRPLQLNDIIEELHRDEYAPVPESITIFPPENCNADVTDEDSGDENEVYIQNLPGSQLRALAECDYSSESDSDDDNTPIAQLAKRPRLDTSSSEVVDQGSSSTQRQDETQIVQKNKTYTWIKSDIRPEQQPWLPKEGPKILQTPLYYFECMFGNNIVDLLVEYTNLYAYQKNKQGNVTRVEMKCFLGILLLSGYVIVPRRYMYWENAADCGMSIVYDAMSRDRFTFIMSNLHCCDNTQLQANDTFSKLKPFFDALNENFLQFAPFEENHSIDEAMVPYYGGHPCKQFIRGKPIRWGYKFWVGATRLGYINWFSPYQGQSGNDDNKYQKAGLGGSVILRYSDVLRQVDPAAPFHLYFDNFFTSIPLLDELKKRCFKSTGTVRENRTSKCPLPSNKVMQKTERGNFQYRSTRAEGIVVCKWNDNSVVTVGSNAVKVLPPNKVKRFSKKEKKYIQVDQTAVIKLYNENMGGVDRSNQNIGLYRTSIRGKKWYFPLITHGLDMAMQNAWQLYKINDGEYDNLKFKRSVAVSLLETNKKNGCRK